MPNPDPKASGMADRHLVPNLSYEPPVDYQSGALTAEQIHSLHVAQQRRAFSDEVERQRDLHEMS